jgi:hypothetical protein
MSRRLRDDDYDDSGFDQIEATLLKEELKLFSSNKAALLNGDFDRKINLSVRIQNDIVRSEKKGERRTNYHGKDDRATSEQVLDPRTRLILFKLLSNGFLEEIDGKIFSFLNQLDSRFCYRMFKYWQRSKCLLCPRKEWTRIRRENLQNVYFGVQGSRQICFW